MIRRRLPRWPAYENSPRGQITHPLEVEMIVKHNRIIELEEQLRVCTERLFCSDLQVAADAQEIAWLKTNAS